jgi:hypothetical protein
MMARWQVMGIVMAAVWAIGATLFALEQRKKAEVPMANDAYECKFEDSDMPLAATIERYENENDASWASRKKAAHDTFVDLAIAYSMAATVFPNYEPRDMVFGVYDRMVARHRSITKGEP